MFAESWHKSIGVLAIPAEIDAHHPAVFEIFDETSHTVGKTLRIYSAGPGTPSLRENLQKLFSCQDAGTLVKRPFHFLAITAAINRNAFGQIAKDRQDDVSLKIASLRQIPGNQPELREVSKQGHHDIRQNHGINHGQVIGADDPWSLMVSEMTGEVFSDLSQISNPVTHQPDG
jgi:hypothetical protein